MDYMLSVNVIYENKRQSLRSFDKTYLITSQDQKLDQWLKSFLNIVILWVPLGIPIFLSKSIEYLFNHKVNFRSYIVGI